MSYCFTQVQQLQMETITNVVGIKLFSSKKCAVAENYYFLLLFKLICVIL